MDDKTIGFIVWMIILGIAGIAKLVAKFKGGVEAAGKVGEAGKTAKSLLDVLLSGDLEELNKGTKPGAEDQPAGSAAQTSAPAPPARPVAARTLLERAAPPALSRGPVAMPKPQPRATWSTRPPAAPKPARPQSTLAQQLRKLAEQKATEPHPVEEARRAPEARPSPDARPAVPAAAAKPTGPLLALDRRKVREAFIWSIILGPPRARAPHRPSTRAC